MNYKYQGSGKAPWILAWVVVVLLDVAFFWIFADIFFKLCPWILDILAHKVTWPTSP